MHHSFCSLLCKSGKTGWGLAVLPHCGTWARLSRTGLRQEVAGAEATLSSVLCWGGPCALDAAGICSSPGAARAQHSSSFTPAWHCSCWGIPSPRSCLMETELLPGCKQRRGCFCRTSVLGALHNAACGAPELCSPPDSSVCVHGHGPALGKELCHRSLVLPVSTFPVLSPSR